MNRNYFFAIMFFVLTAFPMRGFGADDGISDTCLDIPSVTTFTSDLSASVKKVLNGITVGGKYTSSELATGSVQAVYTNLLESYTCRMLQIRSDDDIQDDMIYFKTEINLAFGDINSAILDKDSISERNKALQASKENRIKEWKASKVGKKLSKMSQDDTNKFVKTIPNQSFIKEKEFKAELDVLLKTVGAKADISSKLLANYPGNLFYAMNALRSQLASYYIKGGIEGRSMMMPMLLSIYSIGDQIIKIKD